MNSAQRIAADFCEWLALLILRIGCRWKDRMLARRLRDLADQYDNRPAPK